ncbi:hypothetical protein K3495_g12086 [Podosphaera aphanis]|nr:hypothetical protein K3495_g12086 [Podosphaera aphanis]
MNSAIALPEGERGNLKDPRQAEPGGCHRKISSSVYIKVLVTYFDPEGACSGSMKSKQRKCVQKKYIQKPSGGSVVQAGYKERGIRIRSTKPTHTSTSTQGTRRDERGSLQSGMRALSSAGVWMSVRSRSIPSTGSAMRLMGPQIWASADVTRRLLVAESTGWRICKPVPVKTLMHASIETEEITRI